MPRGPWMIHRRELKGLDQRHGGRRADTGRLGLMEKPGSSLADPHAPQLDTEAARVARVPLDETMPPRTQPCRGLEPPSPLGCPWVDNDCPDTPSMQQCISTGPRENLKSLMIRARGCTREGQLFDAPLVLIGQACLRETSALPTCPHACGARMGAEVPPTQMRARGMTRTRLACTAHPASRQDSLGEALRQETRSASHHDVNEGVAASHTPPQKTISPR